MQINIFQLIRDKIIIKIHRLNKNKIQIHSDEEKIPINKNIYKMNAHLFLSTDDKGKHTDMLKNNNNKRTKKTKNKTKQTQTSVSMTTV